MKTREFNLENWSGETAVISYAVKQRTFDFQGDTFFLGAISYIGQVGFVSLFGIGWDGALATVNFETDFKTPTAMEAAVIAATRWAANHV